MCAYRATIETIKRLICLKEESQQENKSKYYLNWHQSLYITIALRDISEVYLHTYIHKYVSMYLFICSLVNIVWLTT